jgi:CHAT domain-containing protein/lipopolysaccharide biosynthesis regulator YciM
MILLGILVWRGSFTQSDVDKGLIALNDAYRSQRPVEGRVSNLDYAPFITPRGNESVPVNEFERDRADRLLSDALKADAGPRSYHAIGKLYLLKRDFAAAINYFEQARQGDPKNPQIYADLGAAYLEKGKLELEAGKNDEKSPDAGKGSEDLARSLEYLTQALELNPNLLEALFNRALVHQYQQLDGQAEADWRLYLEKDPGSPWTDDARQKLKRLEEKKLKSQKSDDTVEKFITAYTTGDEQGAWDIFKRNTNKITEELINGVLASDAHSAQSLAALNYLGQLQIRKTRDAFTGDLAAVYASATPQTQATLVKAREQMTRGLQLVRQSNFGDAMSLFNSARTIFEKVGDLPEALAAGATIAQAAALQPDLRRGQEILASVIPDAEARNYHWLLAQCLTRQAHIESNLNNYSKGINDANRALQLFQGLDDANGVLSSYLVLAGFYLFLNDSKTSFSYLERALNLHETQPAPLTEVWPMYITFSLNLTARKLYRAALDYQKEALQLGSELNSPLLISRSHQYLGISYGSLQQFDLALQHARLAYEVGRSRAEERNGQSMMANASLKLGDLYRARGDPTSALAAYEESLRLYDGLNFAHYSYTAHKGKFLSYLALNNADLASQELQTVLRLFDDYRERILWERQKIFFFDREQDTYDLAIDFTYFRLGDKWRAFDYSEISRARNLRELMHHGAEVARSHGGLDLKTGEAKDAQRVAPLSARQIQQLLPEEVQLIQCALLEKRLVIWFISRSNIFTTSVEVDSTKLGESVSTVLKQITERDDQADATLKNLYSLLIEPIRDRIEPRKVLCFIPDKTLHYVPFGALMSPDSGRYLLQDFPVMVSPSATILIESTRKASVRNVEEDERLLAVGNPSFDRSASPNAANLPGAEREVGQIAKMYPLNKVLVGPKAIRRAIIDEITRADIAHFAAHFEIDPRSSLSSKLLLGTEPGERAHAQPAGLSAADIYQIKTPRTKLAVLSACNTGIEQQFAGEGSTGFARSFLVAGVPVVVASLWPVDSDATSDLMIAFHQFRRNNKFPSTESLRQAQMQVLADDKYRNPYYWAGFMVIGGYASY